MSAVNAPLHMRDDVLGVPAHVLRLIRHHVSCGSAREGKRLDRMEVKSYLSEEFEEEIEHIEGWMNRLWPTSQTVDYTISFDAASRKVLFTPVVRKHKKRRLRAAATCSTQHTNRELSSTKDDGRPNATAITTTSLPIPVPSTNLQMCVVCGCKVMNHLMPQHIAGKQHRKNQEATAATASPTSTVVPPGSAELRCDVCRCKVPAKGMSMHVAGKQHRKNQEATAATKT